MLLILMSETQPPSSCFCTACIWALQLPISLNLLHTLGLLCWTAFFAFSTSLVSCATMLSTYSLCVVSVFHVLYYAIPWLRGLSVQATAHHYHLWRDFRAGWLLDISFILWYFISLSMLFYGIFTLRYLIFIFILYIKIRFLNGIILLYRL